MKDAAEDRRAVVDRGHITGQPHSFWHIGRARYEHGILEAHGGILCVVDGTLGMLQCFAYFFENIFHFEVGLKNDALSTSCVFHMMDEYFNLKVIFS